MNPLEIFIDLTLVCGIIAVCVLSYRKPKTPTEPQKPQRPSVSNVKSLESKPLPPNRGSGVESPRRETPIVINNTVVNQVRYPTTATTPARVVQKDDSMLDALPTIPFTGNKIIDFALTVDMLNQPAQYDNTSSPESPATESHYPATHTMEHYTPTHTTIHEPTPSPSPEPTPAYEAPSYSSPDPSPSYDTSSSSSSSGDY